MKGTEKQIAWAKDIIDGAWLAVDCIEASNRDFDQKKLPRLCSDEALDTLRAWLTRELTPIDSAATIIDVRHSLSYDKLLEMCTMYDKHELKKEA